MINVVNFVVVGKPHAKERPRLAFKNGKSIAYTPKTTVNYEKHVKNSYILKYGKNMMFGENIPLASEIIAYYKIPSNITKNKKQMMLNGEILPTVTPDGDNIIKSILDGLNGVAYPDDKQIVSIKFDKLYSDYPVVFIKIYEFKINIVKEDEFNEVI